MIEIDCERNGNWTKRKYYPVSVEKLQQASIRELAYLIVPVNIGEDYEYFNEVKHLLDIPKPRKSLEEISQEFDEKIDELITKTKHNFYASKTFADSKYEKKFDKIFDNFEHAKKTGAFPQYLSVATSGDANSYLVVGNSGVEWVTSWFSLNANKNSVGYYYIEPSLKLYMNKTPNMIVRFCMNKLLDFRWIDT